MLVFLASGLKLDREYQQGVIFRLGPIQGAKGPGVYWTIPIVDQKSQVDKGSRGNPGETGWSNQSRCRAGGPLKLAKVSK